jgi:hypothetical protein
MWPLDWMKVSGIVRSKKGFIFWFASDSGGGDYILVKEMDVIILYALLN